MDVDIEDVKTHVEEVERGRAEIRLRNELMEMFYEGSATNIEHYLQQQCDAVLPVHYQIM